jgi:hypothetical protein
MMPEIQEWLGAYQPQEGKLAILVNALGASEFWGQNVNGDVFPEKALLHNCNHHPSEQHSIDDFTGKIIPPYGYWTFINAHPFCHHKNKDPTRAFGSVVKVCWNPRMHRVELIVVLDKHLALQHGAQHVIDKILAGEFPDCSMGCRVPYDVCSICGHKSKTRNDYCNCVKLIGMGKILDDGRRIGVINTYPRFFDISFVFIGADKTAKMMCKLASGIWVPQSVIEGEYIYGVDEDEGLIKAASLNSIFDMGKEAKAPGGVKRTYKVEGHPDVIKRLDKQLLAMEAMGNWGSSRDIETSIDGDGPEFLYVKGVKGKLDKERFQAALDKSDVNIHALKMEEEDRSEASADIEAKHKKAYDEVVAKAASELMPRGITSTQVPVPSNFFFMDSTKEAALLADDQLAGAPDADYRTYGTKIDETMKANQSLAPADRILMSKEDNQKPLQHRAVSDGSLKTNAGMNEGETDEDYNPDEVPKTALTKGERLTSYPPPSLPVDNLRKDIPKIRPVGHDLPSEEAKVAASRQGRVMEFYLSRNKLWEAARKIKVGPPPKPNRKEYPFTGTINFRGLEVHVENKAGTYREGKGWRTLMRIPYGEFKSSRGTDGDKLDVYVGPHRKCENVYIVHQNFVRGPKKGKYDEDKVMLGFQSAEEAKRAYLAHYDSSKYLRSITTMAFPLFKRALMKREVHGEKVASVVKTAESLSLDDLFTAAQSQDVRRRQRTWRTSDGKETHVTGSGLEGKTKKASVDDWPQNEIDYVMQHGDLPDLKTRLEMRPPAAREAYAEVAERANKALKKVKPKEEKKLLKAKDLFPDIKETEKVAEPLTPWQLLKVGDDKFATQLKWADIVKEIGPDKAVGRVSPLLSQSEPSLPDDVLSRMGNDGLERGLSTASLMGMVLKPREFQRSCLCSMGKPELADELDSRNEVFSPVEEEGGPCEDLDPKHFDSDLMSKLLPFLGEKSYFGPPVRSRIIRITIVKPPEAIEEKEVNSPLLSKVAAAYNWYRREQMKLAGDAVTFVPTHPELHAQVYNTDLESAFGKTAVTVINPRTLAVVLGAIPLTLMYSAHLRGKQRQGEDIGLLKNLVADHPWVTTLGVAAGLREVMKSPHAQQAVDEALQAGQRIWRGQGAPLEVL